VSEAKRAERALVAAKAYVDNLIDTANVLIVELDLEGHAMRLNRMGEEVTGYTLDELADRNWFEVLSPPERKEQAAFYLGSLQQGHTPHSDETALVTRDGRTRMLSWRNTDIRNDAGALVGIISFGTDVTDRIQAEAEQRRLQQAMLRSAEEWRLTFDAVNTPILIADFEGRVTRANHAASALATRPFREIVGQSIAEVSAGEPWATAAELIANTSSDGRGTTAERRDAAGRTWDISVTRFPVTDDPARRFIVVLWETTHTVRLQESLRRSEMLSAMGTLVAGVAHEVRNPLFGMSATLDAYHEELGRPGYEELQSALRREVTRMTVLMQELLEYGRAPALTIEPTALHEVVDLAIHRIAVPRTDVSVENTVRADLPLVPIDPTRMRQVFENLVDNAMQHAPPHSRVNVSGTTIERGGRTWIEARVEDSGPGFATSDFQRVFEPFFTTRQEGIGLGLSIVQRIVEEHAGQVMAANRPEGGAVVTVLLPL
jgi:PAS domain S-box-containing protein